MILLHVNQVIRQTVSLIKESFWARQISIALHTDGGPMITGYPNESSQVLLNILMNALDALVRATSSGCK